MLLTDAFGGQGGIAKFNRDFLGALGAAARVPHVVALPRTVNGSIDLSAPAGVHYERRAGNGALAYIGCVVRLAAARNRADVVICGHINLLAAAWCLARTKRARLILIIHGYEAWTPPRRLFARWSAAQIDGLISVSRHSAERFCGWSGFPTGRTFILPNSVDLDRFKPLPRDEMMAARFGTANGPVLLMLGRMTAHERLAGVDKGFGRLIDLMPRLGRRIPELRLVIAGDGDDRPRLQAQAAALGLGDRVLFTGAVAEVDKAALYSLANVFVLPSMGEGFGIVLIEAAACGLRIVGSARDGSREALQDGALGQLVDPLDAVVLENAIAAALEERGHRERRAGVEQFSVARFEHRVNEWLATLEHQAA